MKHWRKGFLSKFLALSLTLILLLGGSVSAIAPDELKEILQGLYLGGVSQAVLEAQTVEEIMQALDDPYSAYYTKEEFSKLLESFSDKPIVGVGIIVQQSENGLLVDSVRADSPAAQQGVRPGGVIVGVDGTDCAGLSTEQIISLIGGEEGTTVSITLRYPDSSTQTYSLLRTVIQLHSTASIMLNERICFVDCRQFLDQTTDYFAEAIAQSTQTELFVVDLRSNPGGSLRTVLDSLGLFFDQSAKVYLKNNQVSYTPVKTEREGLTDKPIMVLMDRNSASASEIFAGVVRDCSGGLIIGERSYGKGLVQDVFPVSDEGDGLKTTIARYYTPSGSTPDQIGILPHLLVPGELAAEVALLLCAEEPTAEQRADYLRVELGGYDWYIKHAEATAPANRSAFAQLLSALPATALLWQCTGGDWTSISPAALAAHDGLTDYQSRSFTDVAQSPYRDALNNLATYGLLLGDETGACRPEATMTRAELCALLSQVFRLTPGQGTAGYSDVAESDWYADEVRAVRRAGLMEGLGDGRFAPQGTLTHEELFTVLARCAVKFNLVFEAKAASYLPSHYSAPQDYSDWASPWLWLLSASMESEGTNTNLLFAPANEIAAKQVATRGEVGQTLCNILYFSGILSV